MKNIKKKIEAKRDTPDTHIHDLSISFLFAGTSIKSGEVNLFEDVLASSKKKYFRIYL
jgi:hypothetical protein